MMLRREGISEGVAKLDGVRLGPPGHALSPEGATETLVGSTSATATAALGSTNATKSFQVVRGDVPCHEASAFSPRSPKATKVRLH